MLPRQPEERPSSASDAWDELDEIVIAVAGLAGGVRAG
jgi:hypothetical protein